MQARLNSQAQHDLYDHYLAKIVPYENMIKNILVNIIVFVLPKLPSFLLKFSVNIFYSCKGTYAYRILTKITPHKLKKCDWRFVKNYIILTNLDSSVYKVHLVDEERYEQVRTPDVYRLAKDSFVTLRKHEIAIYCFPNAKIRAKSDIIKIGENAFWEKANRPEFAQSIPSDSDYISIDKLNRTVISFEEKKLRTFDSGYSLLGVHTDAWAHFIISYLPKLIAYIEFNNKSTSFLFVPSNMHENMKDLIVFVIKNMIISNNFEIVYVENDEVIQCSKLYYCNAIGYLCDHSTYIHSSSSCISAYGARAVYKVSMKLWDAITETNPRKIYIGRGKGRNLLNAIEVEEYFIKNGFEVVYPHLMTLVEKINIFGNASHICGPVSSGFANMIFCRGDVKILGFFNFARCFDPLISGFIFPGGFNHTILFMTGHEEVNNNINNSYLIELKEIDSCCQHMKYFE